MSFSFAKPTCSICGEDIRYQSCAHFPGEKYDDVLCFYWYDEPLRVYEGSIVYRGADPGTGFGMPESLQAALEMKQENLKIEKTKVNEMDFLELIKKLGLTGVSTEDELKLRISTGDKAVTNLETIKAENSELTKFKETAGPVITSRRDEAVRLLNIAHNGKPDELTKTTLENASPEQVEKFITDLDKQVAELLPHKCQNCGSTDIQIRSSVDEGGDRKFGNTARLRNTSVS